MDDVTGGQDEPKRPVVSRRRGLGKGLGAILPSPEPGHDEQSRRDQLTGLPNRSALDERFEEVVARCRDDKAALAVLVVALDGFSEVNELYGHSVGDDLLHDAASRLSKARRKSDTVARFAGDEFVLVCPYVASPDLAAQLAVRILEELSRPTTVEKTELQLSASIGVVVTWPSDSPEGAPTLETLLGDASLAMRRVKDEGGASWKLFDSSMREDVVVRSQGRQDLRAALDHDGLVLEYEDIVDLATGVAIGESAILGWSQPGTEIEAPQAPLDLVDEAGLAVPVGRWVLDQALSDLSARHAQSPLPEQFRVWVKVAPSLVADPVLLDIVAELTAKHDVSASVLGLDIREPSAAASASTEANLRALQDRGVVMALDDFGSGQSNLALLQRLPISGLKLAPDLVAALGEDLGTLGSEAAVTPEQAAGSHPAVVDDEGRGGSADDDAEERATTLSREAAALVRGLLQLGRALELTVVAQGVESEAQAAALVGLGCAYAQGPFLVGREASPAEVVDARSGPEPEDRPEPEDGPEPEDSQETVEIEDTPEPEGTTTGTSDDAAETETAGEPSSASPPQSPAVTESLWAPGTLAT